MPSLAPLTIGAGSGPSKRATTRGEAAWPVGVVTWTAVVLRRRFGQSRELSKARILLHAIFGTQFLLGFGAYWARISTADAPQPMPVMVTLTVIHTVVGAILFAFSILVVLLCYRLVPHGREVAAPEPRQVTIG